MTKLNQLYIRRKKDSKKANRYRNILAAIKNLQHQLEEEKDSPLIFTLDLGEIYFSKRLKDERKRR